MHYIQSKSILSPQNGMNLYRGCTHGCIYCDSRSRCYQMDHDFTDIAVKINAPALLEDALRRKRKKCMIGTGAMCDPYMPLERELELTRRCLEIIHRYGFGAAVQTKSDLVLRDLDLLAAIHENAKAVVQMTLTTADEALCRILEPDVCTTMDRYRTLKVFQARGIPTVVWLSPILPWLNDTEENLLMLLELCADAGVRGILCFGMGVTLREGDREYFYAQLDRHFPGLRDRYHRTFGLAYECSSPRNGELMPLFHRFCENHGIIHDNDAIFRYLHEFPPKTTQLDMFSAL
ncbi:MAG: radical SAM protein [Clostridia bacterium]|nr:radical SAM protein [Clostridia bacterium]